MKVSLSGFSIKRPISSAAAQCQALTEDPSIPTSAWTARLPLVWRKRMRKFSIRMRLFYFPIRNYEVGNIITRLSQVLTLF